MKTRLIETILTSFIVIVVFFFTSCKGKEYKTVKIGDQIWMVENLNIETWSGSWCYDNNPKNCEKYGRLYNWKTAKKVCPSGWHLPSDVEWTMLTDYLGGEDSAGTKMKSTSGWVEYEGKTGNGTNTSGFTGLPGGDRYDGGKFGGISSTGYWWSSTEYSTNDAWYRSLSYKHGKVGRCSFGCKQNGVPVRCLRNL